MSFSGVATRKRTLAPGAFDVIPTGGRVVTVPDLRNTSANTRTRPVVSMQLQTEDGRNDARIKDVRAGDRYQVAGDLIQVTVRNETAAEVEFTIQTAGRPITRSLPRLPVVSSPWITPNDTDSLVGGYLTSATKNQTLIVAPSSLLSGFERIVRTRLFISTDALSEWKIGPYGGGTMFTLSDGQNLELEDVTDLAVWTNTDNSGLRWALFVTGVQER